MDHHCRAHLASTVEPMKTKALLSTIAVAEFVTGMGLLFVPSRIVELLLGNPLDPGVPLVVARVAGIALISIGLMCWLERASGRGLLPGLLVYNAAIPGLLVYSYLVYATNGIGLWPVVALHFVFALLLATRLRPSA